FMWRDTIVKNSNRSAALKLLLLKKKFPLNNSQLRSRQNATRNDWSGADGRQHGAPPDSQWPYLRRLRSQPGIREAARRRRRNRLRLSRRFCEKTLEAARHLVDGPRGSCRRNSSRSRPQV